MTEYLHHFIDGDWRPSTGRDRGDVVSSISEQVIGRVPLGTAADVAAAVTAARTAFEGAWGHTTIAERAEWLERLALALKAHVPEMATAITHEVGTPFGYATRVQVEFPISMIAANANFIRAAVLERELGHSLVVKEPVGVVGCITPWNYPLHQVVCKIAPALAAGCTVVVKPAELAPLSAFMLAEAIQAIGLPAGVVNIVSGEGRVVGEAIAAHPGIDMVSFTGSLAAGRRVAAVAADGIKKVCLELGGKSASIVLDDAPFEKAVTASVNHGLQNSGQTCSAWTRLLVPRPRYAEAVAIAVAHVARLRLGDPFEPGTRLGPLVSAAQRERVLGYIAQGLAEGARVVAGGGRPAALPTGFYVEPTVFADVDNRMVIAQEEIFGPVLALIPHDGDDDAVRIANDSPYGLAGGVWSGSSERATAVARRLRTGQVDINGGRFNPLAPFGGYKKSGLGREIGPLALDEFFTLKSIQR
ncbi:MAG: aldehyde dehydrogenase family protein [Acidobacteriota bacterium]